MTTSAMVAKKPPCAVPAPLQCCASISIRNTKSASDSRKKNGAIEGVNAQGFCQIEYPESSQACPRGDKAFIAIGCLRTLGMDNVLKNKASALVGRLGTEFPWLKLHAEETDVRKCHDLFSADLVIDVTGEEALGRVINRRHLSATGPESKIPPILYCWIAGEGDGVQAIWVDKKGKHACWECLLQHGNNGNWEARFRFVRNESRVTIVGCTAVTPYAASTAMSAAALASEMISDWLTDKIDPRFRSRARTHGDTFLLRDSSPLRLKGCPACGRT